MVLALLLPVAFLLFLLAMERVEARLFPAESADLGKDEVGHRVERSSDDHLTTPLVIAASPVAGAGTVPATAL